MLVLSGIRPEEIAAWREGPVAPAAALDLGASAELQGQTVEHVVDTAKRVAARGGHVVVLIDTLDGLPPHAARRILAGARNLVEGGSLTLIATATRPLGGESTVIALDVALTSTGRIPALDLAASGVVRPELLVGEDGAAAITKARAALGAGGLSLQLAQVGDARPGGLRRELDRLAAAGRTRIGGLHVGEAARLLDERHSQLTLVDALIQPCAAEHQTAQPVHQRALRRADQIWPALVDVLPQRGGGVEDLAVDREVDEVFQLVLPEPARPRTPASGPPARSARRSHPR